MTDDDPAPWRPQHRRRHVAMPTAPKPPKVRQKRPYKRRRPLIVVPPEARAYAGRLGAARRRLRGTIAAAYEASGTPAYMPAWAAYDAAPAVIQRQWRDRADALFSIEQERT